MVVSTTQVPASCFLCLIYSPALSLTSFLLIQSLITLEIVILKESLVIGGLVIQGWLCVPVCGILYLWYLTRGWPKKFKSKSKAKGTFLSFITRVFNFQPHSFHFNRTIFSKPNDYTMHVLAKDPPATGSTPHRPRFCSARCPSRMACAFAWFLLSGQAQQMAASS